MRSLSSATIRKPNLKIKTFFDSKSHFADSYKRFYSTPTKDFLTPAKFTIFDKIGEKELEVINLLVGFKEGRDPLLDLSNPKVLEFAEPDIELSEADKMVEIAIAADDSMTVYYGERGVAASAIKSPRDLLKYSLTIPEKSMGVLTLLKHVPFLIDTNAPNKSSILPGSSLVEVPTFEEKIKKYYLIKIMDLPTEVAKEVSLKLQQKISDDINNEYFYEEITSKVYPPTLYNRSSGTLMNFEEDKTANKTTSSHYHPGERNLRIFTTDEACGVTLNFCGISENPDNRKDCEVTLDFPKNSHVILNFPPFTHHKFHGKFVCLSIHPKEGLNLIKAVESGTLSKGFLETATVFSKSSNEVEKWHVLTEDKESPNSTLNVSSGEQLASTTLNKGRTE